MIDVATMKQFNPDDDGDLTQTTAPDAIPGHGAKSENDPCVDATRGRGSSAWRGSIAVARFRSGRRR